MSTAASNNWPCACVINLPQSLDQVQVHLDDLSSNCQRISSVLATTKQATAPLLSDMERLQRDLDTVEHKGQLIKEFLEQYQLAPEEVRYGKRQGMLIPGQHMPTACTSPQ